jgi:hypothetical protein
VEISSNSAIATQPPFSLTQKKVTCGSSKAIWPLWKGSWEELDEVGPLGEVRSQHWARQWERHVDRDVFPLRVFKLSQTTGLYQIGSIMFSCPRRNKKDYKTQKERLFLAW